MIAEQDIFGVFQRGEDLKYIHFAEFKNEEIVTKAEKGDQYQIVSICGKNGEYKEDDEVEGTIPYDATIRVMMLNMQINHKIDDTTPVPEGNV